MHTHDFALRDAELAIRTLARQVPGDESIHSCLLPWRAGVTSEPVRRWIEESPYTAALGVRARELARERVVLELPFAEINSNPGKALHGGCAASLAAIGGQAVTRLALGEASGPWHTCALQVGYLVAAIDEDVVASATLLREGKQLCFVAVDIATPAGKPIAHATSVVRARLARAGAELQRSGGDAGASDPGPMGPAIGQIPFVARARHPRRAHDRRPLAPGACPFAPRTPTPRAACTRARCSRCSTRRARWRRGPRRAPAASRLRRPRSRRRSSRPFRSTIWSPTGACVQRDGELLWSDAEIASAVDGRVFARGTVVYRIVA